MGNANKQPRDIETTRPEILDALKKGIEFFATTNPNIRYNQTILTKLIDRILSKDGEITNPTGYAFLAGKHWAISQIHAAERQERIRQNEIEAIKKEIDTIVAGVRLEIAIQEISALTTRLKNENKLTDTQENQLKYLLISLNSGYDAADAAFPDVKRDARYQWRKRARTLLLQQYITQNLRDLLENLKFFSIK